MTYVTNTKILPLIYGNSNKKNHDSKKVKTKMEITNNFEKTINKLKTFNNLIEKNTKKHISNLDREIYSLKKKLDILNSKLERNKNTNNNFFNF